MVSEHDLDAIAAEARFSGVVRVDRGNEVVVAKAYGLADRGHEIPNEVDTQFAIASGLKGLTALAVVSLIEDGTLELGTTARSLLGEDLPLIADDVTVEHLLAHRSGIGDYLDEDGGRRDHRLRHAGARAPACDAGGVRPDPRRPRDEVRRRRRASRTATAASSCSPCSQNGRAAFRTTSS